MFNDHQGVQLGYRVLSCVFYCFGTVFKLVVKIFNFRENSITWGQGGVMLGLNFFSNALLTVCRQAGKHKA
jgi:hypothetical protein